MKTIHRCWKNKFLSKLLVLLGFTAPITLASCYGPMPAEYVSADAFDMDSTSYADSVQNDGVDSLSLHIQD